MPDIIVFKTSNGEILRQVSCPSFMAASQCGDGESWIHGRANDETQYICPEVWPLIHNKPPIGYALDKAAIKADGTEVCVLTAEAGTCAVVAGQEYVLTEPLEISSDMPGSIVITLSHPVRLDTTVTIEAVLP